MSAQPGETPSFDFSMEPQEYYDADRLAAEVVWPTLDYYWRGDWRFQSKLGHDFDLIKGGEYKWNMHDVVLIAHNDLLDTDEDEERGVPIVSTATIDVETIVTDERRDVILHRANKHEGEPVLGDEEVDDFTFKISMAYIFDTEGDLETSTSQLIQDVAGEVLWHSDFYTGEDEERPDDSDEDGVPNARVILELLPPPRIYGHDMELLEAGLYVLDVPQSIKSAFASIKAAPITT